jgi:DNA-binding transcriptional MerR regulator
MTVRNVRAHQSRGLLPPPEVRGRTGYYGAEHVARLELIRELQADGFNLELIRRLLESSGTAALRFTRALRAPFGEREAEVITAAELAEIGISAHQALEVAASLREHADSIAQAYLKLFSDAVWDPFEAAGLPEERWPEVSEALERLRPLAAESLHAMFGLAMDAATERTLGRLPEPPQR